MTGISTGGGGGGHGAPGENGSLLTRNGGEATGSPVLVPLSGGSGGGGAWSERGRSAGGGGGGALALYAERSLTLLGRIEAEGGDGYTGQIDLLASGGGGGAGGGVMLGAQGAIVLGGRGAISVVGGAGSEEFGPSGRAGGDGGAGRVRVDGRIDKFDENATLDSLSAGYYALATDMSGSFRADDSVEVTGTGTKGRTIRLYHRRGEGPWSFTTPRDTVVDTAGIWRLTIESTGSGPLYVAALEKVDRSEGSFAEGSPEWIMSTAGGLLIGTPEALLDVEDVDFGCVSFGGCRSDTVFITNTGSQSDLFIRQPEIIGGSGWFTIGEFSPIRIPSGTTGFIPLRFCPSDTGSREALLRFSTNLKPENIRTVRLRGCGRAGELRIDPKRVDLGALCPEECRDTTITVTNIGNAPLDVTRLAVGIPTLSAAILDPAPPVRVDPGESREVRIRICLIGSAELYSASFQATTPFASPSLLIEMENLGPAFELPRAVPFLERDLGKTDTCPVATFELKNLRADAPLRIGSILPRTSRFQILEPAPGTTIPPGESRTVVIRLCESTVGEFDDTLDLGLESGPCRVDTLLPVRGRVTRSVPELALSVDEKLDLGTLPVGRASPPGTIRILNNGEGRGRDLFYRLEPIAPATAAEFVLTPAAGAPFDLPGGEVYPITVAGTPADVGLRSARLVVGSGDGSWLDTVTICMDGVQPGIVADRYFVPFDPVRRGDRSTASLRLYNQGTSSDQVVGLRMEDSTAFRVVGLRGPSGSSFFPMLLRPDLDTIEVSLEFQTSNVGTFTDTLRAVTAGGEEVRVILSGLSGLEQAVAESGTLPFSCEKTEQRLVVTNRGSWVLKIDRLTLEGESPGAFRILDQPGPDELQPEESRSYRIRYLGSEQPASARVRVQQSGPEGVTVRLVGERCAPESIPVTLKIPDIAATIGEEIAIPVELIAPGPLPEEIPLKIRVTFDAGTLNPLPAESPVTGLRGIAAAGVESVAGTIEIDAQIPAGTSPGGLFEISAQVLRGAHYRTTIALLPDSGVIPARYAVTLDDGSITVLDCDTTGGVDLGNLFVIKQSRPNPAAAVVTIPLEIPRTDRVEITLYASDGRKERVLFDETLEEGDHVMTFDVSSLPAGLYYYEVRSGEYRATGRMLLQE